MAAYSSNSSNNNNIKSKKWRTLLCMLTVLTFTVKFSTGEPIPSLCDTVACPALSEMSCPEDSEIRETLATVELLQTASSSHLQAQAAAPPAALSLTAKEGSGDAYTTNNSSDELFAQCCLAKKCVCKTCYIRDCHERDEVVVELEPENMSTPGHCCGKYECMPEPNCTEVYDTQHYWLRECKRCKCYSGQQICHVNCDESAPKEGAMCNSKNLNTLFRNGDSWKDGCYECKCVNGEEKCVIPFCASLNCPARRQVILKDSCCPTCWPKGAPMPNDSGNGNLPTDDDDDDYVDETEPQQNYEDSAEALPPLPQLPTDTQDSDTAVSAAAAPASPTSVGASTSAPTERSSSSSSFPTSAINEHLAVPGAADEVASVPPCAHAPDAKFLPYYIVIVMLVVVIIGLFIWIILLRAKQRSYRPVSNFDDNFNKMSPNIKMNAYA